MPWPAVILIYSFIAWKIGGRKLGIGTCLGLMFLVITGIWAETMLSVYLCGIAVIISFVVGSVLVYGRQTIILFRQSCDPSTIHPDDATICHPHPICDDFQNWRVYSITGDYCLCYCAVNSLYGTWAAQSARRSNWSGKNDGCSKRQLLWSVKIPLALPVMMLGLNQTIMWHKHACDCGLGRNKWPRTSRLYRFRMVILVLVWSLEWD